MGPRPSGDRNGDRHGSSGWETTLFGALLLVVSSVYFALAGVHIYWPRGVFTMVAMAVAFGWLALTAFRDH